MVELHIIISLHTLQMNGLSVTERDFVSYNTKSNRDSRKGDQLTNSKVE